MRYNGFTYLIKEGFRNVFKNKKSSMISIITMMCAMFLFGCFFAIGQNIEYLLDQVQKKQGIEVFIFDNTTDDELAAFENEVKALDGVNIVVYKTKQQALESFKEQLKDNPDLLDGYEGENNIFPASFVITLTDLEKKDFVEEKIISLGKTIAKQYGQEIENEDGEITIVKKITDKETTIEMLISIVNGVRITIGIIFSIILIISITIISNTIKLTVHARRKEISIMKYVGATNNFIRWPFVVEGIIIGLIAGIITLLIVGGIYDFIIQNIEATTVLQKMNITLLRFSDLIELISIVYAVLGVGVGIVGSSISMKKYLEV